MSERCNRVGNYRGGRRRCCWGHEWKELMGHHVLGENAQRVLIKFVAEIDIPLAKDGLEFSRTESNVMFFYRTSVTTKRILHGDRRSIPNNVLKPLHPKFTATSAVSPEEKNPLHEAWILTPLIKMFCPLTQAASGLAKKATTGAISSTVPIRFEGCEFAIAVITCSGLPSLNNAVSTGPNNHHVRKRTSTKQK